MVLFRASFGDFCLHVYLFPILPYVLTGKRSERLGVKDYSGRGPVMTYVINI
jgi:hypothetical protein